MRKPGRGTSLWTKLPITLRAIFAGFLIAAAAANVWLLLLLNLGVQLAAAIEAIFLALFLWWARGGGPPSATQAARAKTFRRGKLTSKQWLWGLIGAFFIPSRPLGGLQWWSRRLRREFVKKLAFAASCSSRSNNATGRQSRFLFPLS